MPLILQSLVWYFRCFLNQLTRQKENDVAALKARLEVSPQTVAENAAREFVCPYEWNI